MYAELLRQAADDAAHGGANGGGYGEGGADDGIVANVLAGHEYDRPGSALALRFLGAVHRLVLDGQAAALAAHYPSVGGTADPLRAWPAFRETLREHREAIRALLATPPQTNEVGRAGPLIGGLLHIAATHTAATGGMPIRLLEIGTSAGLNLRADHFRYEFGAGNGYGPPKSPVVLREAWRPGGTWPVRDRPLSIVERRGCDPTPIDPTTSDGRLRLLSYVWPDQTERIARLRGAIEIARRVPATVVRATAAEFLHDLRPLPNVTTVVWHSVMWQYLPRDERAAVRASLERAGAVASPAAPLAYLRFEPPSKNQPGTGQPAAGPEDTNGAAFRVTLRGWPGGDERVLGTAPPHGCPVSWY